MPISAFPASSVPRRAKSRLIDGGSEPADNLSFVACSRRYRQIALDRDGLGVFRKRHAVLLYHGGAAVKVMAERRLGQIGLEAQGRHRQMLHQLQLAVFVLAVADYRGGIKARHFDMVGRFSVVFSDIPYHLLIPARCLWRSMFSSEAFGFANEAKCCGLHDLV